MIAVHQAAMRRRSASHVLAAILALATAGSCVLLIGAIPQAACRGGWVSYHDDTGGDYCGFAWNDDWGYQVDTVPMQAGVGLAGLTLAAAVVLGAIGLARPALASGLVATLAVGFVLVAWGPATQPDAVRDPMAFPSAYSPYVLGLIASRIPCPDPRCAGLTLEQALTAPGLHDLRAVRAGERRIILRLEAARG